MQTMNVHELIPHPRNSYFFDDIAGEAWTEFLGSVKSSGIIEPIIVTQNKVIVSGHQRRRAALELGIKEVVVETKIFDSEDDVLKALIETNIRQRGAGNPNPVKFGRCLKELERIEGIQHGGSREEASGNNCHLKTQADLAEELGIAERTLRNYKALADATPTLQEIVEAGKITPTSALKIIRSMPEEEQEAIAKEIAKAEEPRVTPGQIAELEQRLKRAEAERDEAKAAKPEVVEKVVEKVVEVIPDDYDSVKESYKRVESDYRKLWEQSKAKDEEITALKGQLGRDKLLKEADTDVRNFTHATYSYIKQYGGHVWAFEQFNQLSEPIKEEFVKAIKALDGFAQQLITNLEGNVNG